MPPIRFKVRTLMIVIAAAAVLMGLLRWSPPTFAFLATVVVEITPFVVYYWFLRTRRRQYSEDQSPVPDNRGWTEAGQREGVG
jgi:Flp pilus assembly protein TadB